MINIIAAVAENRAIGFENKLIYWLPNDLKRFKQLTTGNTIIMGRHTYESLPHGALPNRRNIVLTRTGKPEDFPGCEVYKSLDEALEACSQLSAESQLSALSSQLNIYIIGGAHVYNEALQKADQLCLTVVHDTPQQADTFFPDYSEWKEVWREDHHKDDRHNQDYSFINYVKG